MNIKIKHFPFLLLSAPAFSDEIELDTIEVFGETQFVVSQKHDVTGLGSVRKNAEQLQREQVENIRDLVRYDPDIAVNEGGGRGTSRGFSMRGVERERIAVDVDGFVSAPVLKRNSLTWGENRVRESSGAMMEQEYENLQEVDLRRGSASAESGSGALGGAVSMRTKDASDFFKNDTDSLAGRLKIGRTSKDDRSLLSFALAGRKAGFSGFAQITRRHGHEIKAHEDLYRDGLWVDNVYVNGITQSVYFPNAEVSGPQRSTPNPLDYKSHSFLSKMGYHFSENHYLGLVLENSRQHYQLREMFLSNYHKGGQALDGYIPIFSSNLSTGITDYTPTRFYIDEHKIERFGFEYQYQGESPWLDSAILRLDRRNMELSSIALDLNCAPWPTVDINCWPTDANYKQGQLGIRRYTDLHQRDYRFDASLNKRLTWGDVEHNAQLKFGVVDSKYLSNYEFKQQWNKDSTISENHKTTSHYQYDPPRNTGKMKGKNYFIAISDRIRFTPKWESSFALRYDVQNYRATPKPTIGITFEKADYRNFSWDFGVAYRPFDGWQITYRNSSGFRNPSIIELIGPNFNSENFDSEWESQGPLKAEKSLNNEIGFSFTNDLLFVEGSYFITRYQNVIGQLGKEASGGSYSSEAELYHNAYNFTTHGFDIKAYLDGHTLWSRLPEGLEFRFGAGVSKIKKQSPLPQGYAMGSTYTFDAISPLRMVYGVEYNAPEGNWGLSLLTTYSKGKNSDELIGTTRQGGLTTQGSRVANIRTKSWRTSDFTAYYTHDDWLTLRFGVYNIFNYRYITWENARQASFGEEANLGNLGNYSALAAPGRNFLVNFEVRF